ncbi:MAG: AraC family transcriptional regulator [Bacteroidota bacterium]
MKPILENIQLGTTASILAFQYAKQDFETPWHFHPQHELTYIEESVGTKFVGDYVGPYQPGELVLLRANLPHCWKNYAVETSRSRSTVVQWNAAIFAEVPELSGVSELLRQAARGLSFDESQITNLLPRICAMPELSPDALYLELLAVLLQLSQCDYQYLSMARFTDDLPNEFNSRMTSIHAFVEQHFGRKIYLREVAALVNLSEQSFSRFFSKMMGRPFFTFLNEYRINIASRMLIDTDRPVAEIGFRCGYESLPFFHKQFNKFKGTSPARYRRRFL